MEHERALRQCAPIVANFKSTSWMLPSTATVSMNCDVVDSNHNTTTTTSKASGHRDTVDHTAATEQKPDAHISLNVLDIGTTLGTGTFGRVFLAKDLRSDRFYAMKVMKIVEVIKLNQTEHVNNERSILLQLDHPFIVKCWWTFHDARRLFMLFEYVAGGELFTHLRSAARFPMSTAKFYTTEVIATFEYLHNLDVIYRDLKPENVLLSTSGHIKLTDFGFSKISRGMTWTLCGTPEYLAPEVIQSKGHNKAVDWWALGILLFEMLVGYPPFSDDNPFGIYEKILAGVVHWPKQLSISPVVKDLVQRLLEVDRTKRIGCSKEGTNEVKCHALFSDINWDSVASKQYTPPIIPRTGASSDTSNFERYREESWMTTDLGLVSALELAHFSDF